MISKANCKRCGQPLPQEMSCEEWEKAGSDLLGQLGNLKS